MPSRAAAVLLLLASAGCAALHGGAGSAALAPLRGEGEVHVYALPLPRDAAGLSLAVEGVALRREGGEIPLQLEAADWDGARAEPRLLAWGRVAPGQVAGLSLRLRAAGLRGGAPAALAVDPAPLPVDLDLRVPAGGATVIWLSLEPGAARGASLTPRFTARLAPRTPPALALYATSAAGARVTALDRRARRVTGVVPVGAEPWGVAVDLASGRAFVALAGEDQVEVLDLAGGAPIARVRLSPGDGPTELALAGRTLVVVNARSRTVSFVDTAALVETGRAPVGDAPGALLVDRSGRRAYVANRGSASVTVLDVAQRAVAGTIPTDPEPRSLGLGREGDRLYVVQRGSAYLAVFALPTLAPLARGYVGLGAAIVRVDPRTDLIYLGRDGEARVEVLEPMGLQRMDGFDLPGPPSALAIDDAENALLALVPDRGALAVVDLTSRRLLAEAPAGLAPTRMAFAGERP